MYFKDFKFVLIFVTLRLDPRKTSNHLWELMGILINNKQLNTSMVLGIDYADDELIFDFANLINLETPSSNTNILGWLHEKTMLSLVLFLYNNRERLFNIFPVRLCSLSFAFRPFFHFLLSKCPILKMNVLFSVSPGSVLHR